MVRSVFISLVCFVAVALFPAQAKAQTIPGSEVPFEEKPYYTKIFSSQEIREIELAQKNVANARIVQEEAQELLGEATVYRELAIGTHNKRDKRRAVRKMQEIEDEAFDKYFRALDVFAETNQTIYDIYNRHLIRQRNQATPENLSKGIKQESTPITYFSDTRRIRQEARRLSGYEKLDTLLFADRLELEALNIFEKIFMIYNNDDPDNRLREEYEQIEKAREISRELDSLKNLNNSPQSQEYLELINEIYNKASVWRQALDTISNPTARQLVYERLNELTEEETRLLNSQLKEAEENNLSYYENYRERFSTIRITPEAEKKPEVKRAESIEDWAVEALNTSKIQIQEAYTASSARASILLTKAERIGRLAMDTLDIAYELYKKHGLAENATQSSTSEARSGRSTRGSQTSQTSRTTPRVTVDPLEALGIEFKVQIGAFRSPPPANAFGTLAPLSSEKTGEDGGLLKYYVGEYRTKETAEVSLQQIKDMGYADAFIVAFQHDKPIAVETAVEKIAQVQANPGSVAVVPGASARSLLQPAFNTAVTSNPAQSSQKVPQKSITQYAGLIYSVQIATADKNKAITYADLNNLQPVYQDNSTEGVTKYTAGIFRSMDAATNAQNKIKEGGIADAFVVAYYNGKRITTGQAKNIEKGLPNDTGSSNNTTTTTPTPAPANNHNIVFQVQVASYNKEYVPANAVSQFKSLAGNHAVEKHPADELGLVVITIGRFNNEADANNLQKELTAKGAADSFVVAYQGNRKMQVHEARQIIDKDR